MAWTRERSNDFAVLPRSRPTADSRAGLRACHLTFDRVVAQAMANRMAGPGRVEGAALSAADDVSDAEAEKLVS